MRVDQVWLEANRDQLPPNFQLLVAGRNNEVGLHDSEGRLVRNWHDIERALPPFIYDATTDDPSAEHRTHIINDKGLFMPDPTFGFVPVEEIQVTYKVGAQRMDIKVLGTEIVKFILRDLKSGQIHRFKSEGGTVEALVPTS